MDNIINFLGSLPYLAWTAELQSGPLVIFLIITGLFILFLLIALRSMVLAFSLGRLATSVRQHGNKAQPLKLKKFANREPYKHLWSEYQDTLHPLKYRDGRTEYRATIPAETLFTTETLFDNRRFVWNDFVRHLPGILTGLGIIGTFSGLLTGLENFTPSEDANAARESLDGLLLGVKEAFHLSAYAITLAVVATFLEKSSLTWAYKNVEKLTHAIDALYEVGAGEEYLARLVEADEANTAQTAQLKDALVNDLRTLLTELTDRQVQAIGQLEGTVNVSMNKIAEGVEKNGASTTDNLSASLEQLMTAFLAQMNDALGEQMRQINLAMQQSTQTMQQVQQSLEGLVNNIQSTTEAVMEDVIQQMEGVMQKAADNQENMTTQMQQFIDQLSVQMQDERNTAQTEFKSLLSEFVATTHTLQNSTTKGMEESVSLVTNKLAKALTQIEESHNHTNQQTEQLLQQTQVAIKLMQENMTALRQTTQQAIQGMNQGADKLKQGAEVFAHAGQSVSGVLDKATPLANQMAGAGSSVAQASQYLAEQFSHYQKLKNETQSHIDNLQQLLMQTQQEGEIKQGLIQDIERVANTLQQTERESTEYLEKVNAVLLESFNKFGNAMQQQVKQSITQTDEHLSKGMNQFSGVLQELGAQLQKMRNRR